MTIETIGFGSSGTSAGLELATTYSADTKIFIWPEPEDLHVTFVNRRCLQRMAKYGINGTMPPKVIGRGLFPREYALFYQPHREMPAQELDALVRGIARFLSESMGFPELRVSFNIQDKTGGHYSAGQCVSDWHFGWRKELFSSR